LNENSESEKEEGNDQMQNDIAGLAEHHCWAMQTPIQRGMKIALSERQLHDLRLRYPDF